VCANGASRTFPSIDCLQRVLRVNLAEPAGSTIRGLSSYESFEPDARFGISGELVGENTQMRFFRFDPDQRGLPRYQQTTQRRVLRGYREPTRRDHGGRNRRTRPKNRSLQAPENIAFPANDSGEPVPLLIISSPSIDSSSDDGLVVATDRKHESSPSDPVADFQNVRPV